MTAFIHRSSLLLFLLLFAGCQAHGPSAAGSSSDGSATASDLPTGPDVQDAVIKGLTIVIPQNCPGNNAALLDSLKSIRYEPGTVTLLNQREHGYKDVRVSGTIYWSYKNQMTKEAPSAGTPLTNVMSNDPDMANPRNAKGKWNFFGTGPWSDLLKFKFGHGCQYFEY